MLSLRHADLERVYHYVDHQEEHHRSQKTSALLEMIETDNADWAEAEA